MKKLFLLGFLICCVLSCSPEEENFPTFFYETLPIESVIMPEEFQYGHTHEITMTYLKPSSCHVFNDFYYLSVENQRTIAIINTVFSDLDCVTYDNEVDEVSFNFQVNGHEPYVFKFWQGEDESGNDIYHVVEVPVIE